MYITKNISHLRKASKMSQKELAAIIGVRQSQIVAYEKGTNIPKIDGIIKISDYFNVAIGDLFDKDLSELQPISSLFELGELTKSVHALEQLRTRLLREYPDVARALGVEVGEGEGDAPP